MNRFVLIGDLVNSRKIKNRQEFALILKEAILDVNMKYGSAFQSKIRITKGVDEFSAIISDYSLAPSIIVDLALKLYPHVARFALVKGEVDILSDDSSLSDGPAFHDSNSLILKIERSGHLFGFRSDNEIIDSVFSLLIHNCLFAISKWPRSAAKAAFMKRSDPDLTLQQIGSQLHISHQAVSAALGRSKLDDIELAERLFMQWLLQHFPKSHYTGSN